MKYIFLDLEMNPVNREFKEVRKCCSREIIEIGAVMLDVLKKKNAAKIKIPAAEKKAAEKQTSK